MTNGTVHITVTIPLGQEVVRNVTHKLESKLLWALMKAQQDLEKLSKQNNVLLLFIICLCLLTLCLH